MRSVLKRLRRLHGRYRWRSREPDGRRVDTKYGGFAEVVPLLYRAAITCQHVVGWLAVTGRGVEAKYGGFALRSFLCRTLGWGWRNGAVAVLSYPATTRPLLFLARNRLRKSRSVLLICRLTVDDVRGDEGHKAWSRHGRNAVGAQPRLSVDDTTPTPDLESMLVGTKTGDNCRKKLRYPQGYIIYLSFRALAPR